MADTILTGSCPFCGREYKTQTQLFAGPGGLALRGTAGVSKHGDGAFFTRASCLNCHNVALAVFEGNIFVGFQQPNPGTEEDYLTEDTDGELIKTVIVQACEVQSDPAFTPTKSAHARAIMELLQPVVEESLNDTQWLIMRVASILEEHNHTAYAARLRAILKPKR